MYSTFIYQMRAIKSLYCLAFLLVLNNKTVFAQKTYDVGPGYPKTQLNQIPWAALAAGDVVNIHYDVNGYHEKFLISTSGTLAKPIKIVGIAGPNGEKPIIDGDKAKALSGQICYAQTQPFGLIFIEPGLVNGLCANGSYAAIPHDIVIDNLEIRNAHPTMTYSVDGGAQQAYSSFSCGIYAERVQNLVVSNCNFNHCGLGLFINSKFGTNALSQNILVERNTFTQNGVVGDGHDHNSYIEAVNVVYQYNFYDHLVNGSSGASIKDRSAGNVFRYNWIVASEGHAVQIAEPQGGLGYIDQIPAYRQTYMYGNVIYNAKLGAARIIRYGGDQGIYSSYRQGTLYFYNNTVIDEGDKYNVPGAVRWATSLFLLPDSGEVGKVTIKETVDCRNNIIYNQAATPGVVPTTFNLMSTDLSGTINMTNNWVSPGTVDMATYYNTPINLGSVNHINTLNGNNGINNPDFNDYINQDYTLSPLSNAVNKGTNLIGGAVNYPVLEEYVKPLTSKARVVVGPIDLGAYENVFVAPTPVSGVTVTPPSVSLGMGQYAQLVSTVLPANASNKNVMWSSSNAAVVVVSPLGLIQGVSGGTATITVTTQDGNYTAATQVSVQQTVVGWNFKNKTAVASSGIAANLAQQITRETGFSGLFDYSVAGAGTGTDWCLSTINWDNGANTKYWLINFTTSGYYNLKFSSIQRGNSSGTRDYAVQYRVGNASTWTTFATVKDSTDWIKGALSNIALPAVCDNQALVQVRWLQTSNVTPLSTTVLSTGSGRIDEITVVGDNTPPIASLTSSKSTQLTTDIKISPNPTHGDVQISINLETASQLHLSLLDMNGRILKELDLEGINYHHEALMDISTYTQGIYHLVVKSGDERIVRKVVKIK